jgi:hypothetical protein
MECLRKVKSKEYSDRVKKNLPYEHLITKLKETDPGANKEKVVKKINSLRSCFRTELKKVYESEGHAESFMWCGSTSHYTVAFSYARRYFLKKFLIRLRIHT